MPPPGPAYGFLCVANSVFRVLSNVAEIRAAQLARNAGAQEATRTRLERRNPTRREEGEEDFVSEVLILKKRRKVVQEATQDTVLRPDSDVLNGHTREAGHVEIDTQGIHTSEPALAAATQEAVPTPPEPTLEVKLEPQGMQSADATSAVEIPIVDQVASISATEVPPIAASHESLPRFPQVQRKLQSSKVPSSRIGRLFHYGGLAASLSYGAAAELLRRSTHSDDDGSHNSNSLMLSEGNVKRLVAKLTKMRGAALKIGQFLSIQDSHVLPPEVESIFRRVQDSAHYMPDWQMEQVMQSSLGADWASNFVTFDRVPFAAASIGQVHGAVLAATVSPTGRDEPVAVKIQFPNIRESIESDLGYVKMLLTAGRILPRGLFLDRTLQVFKGELADECNYSREASFLRRFGSPECLGNDSRFHVPWVWDGSTDQVLVMERVDGISVGGSVIEGLSQDERNAIAERIIDLCLRELFVFRVMQTDPNWTNFLWNGRTRQVELVDFGATREYSKEFIDDWLHLLSAAAADDKEACIAWSRKVGYLTGKEDQAMLDAHVLSLTLLATPFKPHTPQPFAFGPGSSWADITSEIRAQIPTMLQHRLTPPPRETYSLNRKLSGAFLLAARLDARVDCGRLWEGVVSGYRFD